MRVFLNLFLTFSFFRVFARMALTFKAPRSIHHRLSNLQNESAAFFSLTVKALVKVILLWEDVGVTALGRCKMAP